MILLSRFDAVSRELVQRFFKKVVLFAAFATVVSILQPHGLVLMCRLIQTQCWFAGGMSVGFAIFLHQRFGEPTLTYWDEGVAFAGIGTLSHFATSLM
jgi:hypothetical protein